MKISQFIIEVHQGKIKFNSERHRCLFQSYLNQFEGKYSLEINEIKNTRSEQQHRYYWMYLSLVAEETGHSKTDREYLHQLFKKKFLKTGIHELFNDVIVTTKSTTKLTKGEFCEYLANIQMLTGVELPNTQEFLGYTFHERNYHK